MATTKKISELVSGAPASTLGGTEGLEITQSGASKGATMNQVKSFMMFAGTYNGSLGATTPSTAAVTTLAASGLISANGGQIAFPSSQNPSAGANTFDDYEEGTFTPTMLFGGASVGVTYTTQTGQYTKLGNVCLFLSLITLSSKGSSTGSATIGGLPFTNGSLVAPCMTVCGAATMTSVADGIWGFISASNTAVNLSMAASTGRTNMTDANFTNTSSMQASGHYMV